MITLANLAVRWNVSTEIVMKIFRSGVGMSATIGLNSDPVFYQGDVRHLEQTGKNRRGMY